MGSSASVLQSGRKEIRAAVNSRGAYLVGIAGRFPNADNVEELWEQLKVAGESGVIEQSPARWPASCLPYLPAATSRIKHENEFDADFWHFSDIRTCTGNPILRHLLEVIYEAVLDSGLSLSMFQSASNPTGVYIALSTDFDCIITCKQSEHFLAARSSDMPSHISRLLGTCGPAVGVDADSSSSLVAADIALRDLQRGIVQFAIVAGGSFVVNPLVAQGLQYLSSGSEDPRRAQSSQADGIAAIILAREMAMCCRIYSVLLGSGSSFDGSREDDTAHFDGQSLLTLVKETCRNSGVRHEDIVYIESSGPGIQAIDEEEIKTFFNALVQGRPESEKVLTCAATTNSIGHCHSVAGLVSIIVSVLAMHHGSVPHCFTHKEYQLSNESQLQTPWRRSGGIVLVTSRGLGGTNACLLLARFHCKNLQNTLTGAVLLPLHARCDRGFDRIYKSVEQSCRSCLQKLLLIEKSLLVSDALQPMRGYIIVSPELEILAAEKLPPCEVSQPSMTLFWGDFSSVPVTVDPKLWQIPAFAESLEASDKIFEELSGGVYNTVAECDASLDRKLEGETTDGKITTYTHIIFGTAIQIGLAETMKQACGGWAAVAGGGLGVLAAAYYDGCLTQRQCLQIAYTLSTVAGSWADDLTTGCLYEVALVHLKSDEVYQLGPNIRILAILTDFLVVIGIPRQILQLVDSVQKQIVLKGGRFQPVVTSPFFNPLLMPNIRDIALQRLKAIIPHPKQWSGLGVSSLGQSSPKSVTDLLCNAEHIINSLLRPLDQPALMRQMLREPDSVVVAQVPGCEGGMLSADGRKFAQADSSRILGWSPSLLNVLNVLGKLHTLGCKINLSAIRHQLDSPLDCSAPPLSPLATWAHTTCWPFPHWMEFTCKEKDELISMYSFSLDKSGDDSSTVADILYRTWFAVATRLQNMDMSKPTGVRLFSLVEEQNIRLIDCTRPFFLQVQLGRKAFNMFNEDGVILSGRFEELKESPSQPIANFRYAYWDNRQEPAVEGEQAIWMVDWENDWQLYLRQILQDLENGIWRTEEYHQQMDGSQGLAGGLPEEVVFLPQHHAKLLESHQNSVMVSFQHYTGLLRAGGVILHFNPLLAHGAKRKEDNHIEILTQNNSLVEESHHRLCTFDEKAGLVYVTVTKDFQNFQHALDRDTSSEHLSSELRGSLLQTASSFHQEVAVVEVQENNSQSSSPKKLSASLHLPVNQEKWNKPEKVIGNSGWCREKHPSWITISCGSGQTWSDKTRMLADDQKSDDSCSTSLSECFVMPASLSSGSSLSPSSNKENTNFSTTSHFLSQDQAVDWPVDSVSLLCQENEMNLTLDELDERSKRQFPFSDISSTPTEQGNPFGQESLQTDQVQVVTQNASCVKLASEETKDIGVDGMVMRTDRTMVKHIEVVHVCEDIQVLLFYGVVTNTQRKVAGLWSEEYPDEVLQVCVAPWWKTRHQHFFLLWVTAMYIMDSVDLKTTKSVLMYPPFDSLSLALLLAVSPLDCQVFVLAPEGTVPEMVHKICPGVRVIPEVFWGHHLQQSSCMSGCTCLNWCTGDINYAMDQLPASGRLIQCGRPLNSICLSMTFFNKNTTLVCVNPQQAIRDTLARLSQTKDTGFLRLQFPSLFSRTSCELILSLKMSDCLGSGFESQHADYFKQPVFLPLVLKAHRCKDNQEATDGNQNVLLQPEAITQYCCADNASENKINLDPFLSDFTGRDVGYKWPSSLEGFPESIYDLSEHNLCKETPVWCRDLQGESSLQTAEPATSDWSAEPDDVIDYTEPSSSYYMDYCPTGLEGAVEVTNESPEMTCDPRGSRWHSQTFFGTENKGIIEERPVVCLSGSSTYVERCLSDSEVQEARYFTLLKDEVASEKDDLQDTFSIGEPLHVKDNTLENGNQLNGTEKELTCNDQTNIGSAAENDSVYMSYISTLFEHDICAVQLQVNIRAIQQNFPVTENVSSLCDPCSDSECPGDFCGNASAWISERQAVCNETTDVQISSTAYSSVSSAAHQVIEDIEILRCVSSPETQITSQNNDSLATEPPCCQDEQDSIVSCSWCGPASENMLQQSQALLEDDLEEPGSAKILLPAKLMDLSELEPITKFVAGATTDMDIANEHYTKTVPSSADLLHFDGCLLASASESSSFVSGVGLNAADDQRDSAKQTVTSVATCEENLLTKFHKDGSNPVCEFHSTPAIFSALPQDSECQHGHNGCSSPSGENHSGATGNHFQENRPSFSSDESSWREQLRHENCEGSFAHDQSVSGGAWMFESPPSVSPRIPLFCLDPFVITKSASSSALCHQPQVPLLDRGCLGEQVSLNRNLASTCQHNDSTDSEARRMVPGVTVEQACEDFFHQSENTSQRSFVVGADMSILENQDMEGVKIVSLTTQPSQHSLSDSSTPKQDGLKTCASPQSSFSDDASSQIVQRQRNLPNPILRELFHSEDALMSPPSDVQCCTGCGEPHRKSEGDDPEQATSRSDDNLDLDFAFQFDSHDVENENNAVLEIPLPVRNAQPHDPEERDDDGSQSGDSGIEFQLTEEISSSNQHRFALNVVSACQRDPRLVCALPGETLEGIGHGSPPFRSTHPCGETGCVASHKAAADVSADQMQSLDAETQRFPPQQELHSADHIYSTGVLPTCPETSEIEIPRFSWSPLMLFTSSHDQLRHIHDKAAGIPQAVESEKHTYELDKPKTSMANDSETSREYFRPGALISSTPSRSEVKEQPEGSEIFKVDAIQELQKIRDVCSDHSQEDTSLVSIPSPEGQGFVKAQHEEEPCKLAGNIPDQRALGFENHKPVIISPESHSVEERMTRENSCAVLAYYTTAIPAVCDAQKKNPMLLNKLEISQQSGASLALSVACRPKVLPMLSTNDVATSMPAELQTLNEPSSNFLFKQPLYLVHPITGSVEIFRALASHLDIRCIGIKKTPETPTTSVEDIARHYCSVIKRDNWFGPYCLAGYSYGGLLVFEMARQLQQDGKRVKLLLMLDGSPLYVKGQAEYIRQQIPDVSEDAIPGIMESHFLLHFMDRFIPVPQRALVQAELEKSPSQKERISLAVSLSLTAADTLPISQRLMMTANGSSNRCLVSHECTSSEEVAESIALQRQQKATDFITAAFLASKYHPLEAAELRFVGDVYLIRIKKCPLRCTPLPADYGLSSLCSGKVNVFYVDGDHESIFHDPYVHSVASIVRAILGGKTRFQEKRS